MRIISGRYKGKKLVSVKGLKVRPTSDKLKAAIFNVLFSISGEDLNKKIVLDIFAGSGALGIEALSRGAKSCYFIDNDADAVKSIKKNLNAIRLEEEAVVLLKNYKSGIKVLKEIGLKFDIIFMDPPYKENLSFQVIESLIDNEIYSDGCIIAAEHGIKEILPESIKDFYKVTEKYYGDKVLSFYSPKN